VSPNKFTVGELLTTLLVSEVNLIPREKGWSQKGFECPKQGFPLPISLALWGCRCIVVLVLQLEEGKVGRVLETLRAMHTQSP
jgi:hypothetical protein